jgi:hypothetical protein
MHERSKEMNHFMVESLVCDKRAASKLFYHPDCLGIILQLFNYLFIFRPTLFNDDFSVPKTV